MILIKRLKIAEFSPVERSAFADERKRQRLVTLGKRSYLVRGSMEYGNPNCHILIGRYSSLGHRITFSMGLNHNYRQVTTYPFDDILQMDGALNHAVQVNRNQIIIGNDVWIGSDVFIMGGVCIGNGAVIGAGTVVSKDVPPYAVVVGNPARIIKYRFAQEIIDKLQEIKWWNWSDEKILSLVPEMKDVQRFVDKFSAEVRDDEKDAALTASMRDLQAQGYTIYYCIPDLDVQESVWQNVLENYLAVHGAHDQVALLLGMRKSPRAAKVQQHIQTRLREMGETAPLVLTHPLGGGCLCSCFAAGGLSHYDKGRNFLAGCGLCK